MSASLVPASLRYLDQVARSGSIGRAAKELNVAASAINRQIIGLEESLDVQLFERVAKGMRPTAAGDALISLARRWRVDMRRTTGEIQQLRGVNQGHFRLVAMDSHVNTFLPGFIDDLAREHPRVTLDVTILNTDDAATALMNGEADLAAVFNLSPRRDLHALWSADLPFGFVVAPGHPLARKPSASMQEVVVHPIALQSRALAIRRYLEARHGWLFTDGQKTVETNSLQLVKILARSGRYVAFTSELDAAPELVDGSLVFRPVRDKAAEPQTVGVAIDGRKPLTRIGRTVADLLVTRIRACLDEVRALAEPTRPPA